MADGIALYRGALDGADVVHRVHAEGTEDFVFFETRPAHEELSCGFQTIVIAQIGPS